MPLILRSDTAAYDPSLDACRFNHGSRLPRLGAGREPLCCGRQGGEGRRKRLTKDDDGDVDRTKDTELVGRLEETVLPLESRRDDWRTRGGQSGRERDIG